MRRKRQIRCSIRWESLPTDRPDAPKYWIHETSGELAFAVKTYLADEPLTRDQIELIRAYL